jgi:hypothetical protein
MLLPPQSRTMTAQQLSRRLAIRYRGTVHDLKAGNSLSLTTLQSAITVRQVYNSTGIVYDWLPRVRRTQIRSRLVMVENTRSTESADKTRLMIFELCRSDAYYCPVSVNTLESAARISLRALPGVWFIKLVRLRARSTMLMRAGGGLRGGGMCRIT